MKPLGPKTNCAGRECPERAGCRRYEERIHDRLETVRNVKVPRLEWASLDVERKILGSCSARIALDGRLLKKAA